MFLIGGICWLLFALGFAVLLVRYVVQGAGLQFSGWMFWSGSIVIGLVHVIALAIASSICFAVGAGLWTRGFAPSEKGQENAEAEE